VTVIAEDELILEGSVLYRLSPSGLVIILEA